MGKHKINNLLLSLPLVNFKQVAASLRLFKVKPKLQPASILPPDDCWLCIVQWACPTCLSGVCATTSMQTNRHIPQGIWLSQVNLTQPHSSIKGYFEQMSGGGLRVLVKCLRVCVLSVKQREIVVRDDTADPLLYLSWRTRSIGVVRRIRCMLCLFPQPKERHSSQRSPLCSCLKITSSHTCFPSAWLLLSLFSVSLAFFFFSPHFLPPFPMSPDPCIYHSPNPLWRVHVVPVNKNTVWIFSGASSRRNIWRLMCTLLIVDSDVLTEVTFISSAQQPQLKRTRIKQGCTCEAIAHDLFQYQESHWYSDKFLL